MNKILLTLSCVIAVFADMSFVWWAKKDSHPILSMILGIFLMNLASLIWMYTMRKGIESATAITFYALFTVAGCSLLGFIVFKEQLSFINSVGLILSVFALILIGL